MLFPLVAACATAFLVQGVVGQQCALGTAKEIKGNWYCSAVDSISYTNFPGTGFYDKVTKMIAATGQCETEKYSYSGSLAPLNEELSIHIRGPTWLKELAVYIPSSVVAKRSNEDARYEAEHHAHHHGSSVHAAHSRLHKHAERAVGDVVTATMNGQVVQWINEYAGPAAQPVSPGNPVKGDSNTSQATAMALSVNFLSSASTLSSSTAPTPHLSLPSATSSRNAVSTSAQLDASPSTGSWTRQAYYNAGEGVAEGLTFLNHFGQADSIPAFGASLSFASNDAKSGVSTSQVLANSMLQEDTEVVILSNRTCVDGSCGYTRPGGLAYHGFGGDHKIFLISFTMPATGKTGFNSDMPAIWLMNAQIPLTSQYGTNPACSCWTSGCGEFDVFEVLDSGNHRCKSTLHMLPAGGSSDYFQRPVGQTVKAAIVFTGANETVTIQILDETVSFGKVLTDAYVHQFISGVEGKTKSLFRLVA